MHSATTRFLTAVFLLAASGTAFAHPGHDVSGFAAGLMHPFSGLDHLLAMVAVGLWAAQGGARKDRSFAVSVSRSLLRYTALRAALRTNGERIEPLPHKIWLLPAAFMTMLAVGSGIAMQWQSLPLVEPGIATSVLALGLLIALSLQLPASLSVAITGLFGLLHGYAHGLELPRSAAPVEYALGFLAATAALHLGGIAAGLAMRQRYALLTRFLGSAIAVSGVCLLASA
jgi:urease accessory protein